MRDVTIEPIADHLHLIETIASWHWQEWGGSDPEGSLEPWTEGLRERVLRHRIPTTFVALGAGEEPCGSVTLVDCDMDTRADLWPWLAGLYVRPATRRHGVGSALTRHATAFVANLGIGALYLYTSSAEGLYRALGWRTIGREPYEGKQVAVMGIDLRP